MVNKYGEKCRRVGAFFQPLVLEARSGGKSKTTAKIIKKHAMLEGHRMGSDTMFLHRRWLQKLSIKVQVLNANFVAICMPYGDACHTMFFSPAKCRRFVPTRGRGAAGADGKPPAASGSKRAGGDGHFVSSGIRSS
jgi:hypothetical protein